MLETIGYIIWILITLSFTIMPFIIGCLVGFKGGFGRINALLSSVSIFFAAVNWYFIFKL
jgi:uncharacterized membrane protein